MAIVLFVLMGTGLLISAFYLLRHSMIDTTIDSSSQESSRSVSQLAESVLMLIAYDENHEQLGTGSGFIAFDDSTIVTNFHVIDGACSIEGVSEQDIHYAFHGISAYDEDLDLALLKFDSPSGLPVLPLGDSSSVAVGDKITTIGSPIGLKNTVSEGIISAFREENDHPVIQITAPISPGSSGGALFNQKGEVIGVTFAGMTAGQNLNFCIPSASVFGPSPTGWTVWET
jgi:S1-C subfamily serine protease